MVKKTLAAVLIGMTALSAGASVVDFRTRYSNSGAQSSGGAYQALIDGLMAVSPTSGYCDATPIAWNGLSNIGTCGGSQNYIAFEISATFNVTAADAGVWGFRVGPDFGLGGALFLDGIEMAFNANDMWWNGSYSNPTQILTGSRALTAGTHVLVAYGLEACCDGPQQAQFVTPSAGPNGWQTFSVRDGNNPVPEPATLALLGLGLAGLGFSRRKQ